MPIEDIDFLYQNSIKENIIIFVDSSKRNRKLYPNVSEFQIDFHEPFTFVYGIEVLDTTIPRTTFMIENYNNTVKYRKGFNLLKTSDWEEIKFIQQDFSTAEIFYQRINEQLTYFTTGFEIDNFDNVFDNSLVEQRTKSDYPIVRFKNAYPFIFDMKNSNMFNVLGFDQFPRNEDNSKYSTIQNILNHYIPINMMEYDNLEEYTTSFLPTQSRYESTEVLNDENGTLNTVYMMYAHFPIYSTGTFLQKLVFSTNRRKTYLGTVPIEISVKNISTNKVLFSGLTNDLFNKITSSLEFPYQSDYLIPNTPNTHLVLTQGSTYEIMITNVFIHNDEVDTFEMSVNIGYSYFINLKNLDMNNDNFFISKPIFSENDTKFVISKQSENPDLRTICYNNSFITFTINTPLSIIDILSLYSTGTIRSISVEVEKDSFLSSKDLFILTLKRVNNLTNTITHCCEFILNYHNDTSTNKAYLSIVNEHIEYSVFNYINLDFSIDPTNENYLENISLHFTLYSRTSAVKLIGGGNNHNVNIELLFFKEFGIVSPGMLNLASENYIILRCEEIENHLRGSYDIKDLSPGLGVLNIDVQGYASGRTEFFSVKYKEFHPIGKLNKLKFRFERKSDGGLYDFKNIDLHFILLIKYLRPIQKNNFEKSTLNPNYNPNYLGYFNKTMQDLYDEESSDDDSDIENNYFESDFNDRENALINKMKTKYI